MTIYREGFGMFRKLQSLGRSSKPGAPVSLRFRSLKHPLLIRPGTSDVGAALDNIVRQEYGRYPPRQTPRVLVDAGAYIGDTSAFFLNRYPTLKCWSLEPNPTSFALAARNLAPYGDRANVMQVALSGESGKVWISGSEVGARIGSGEGTEVPAMTVADLLKLIPYKFIDILKLDIEGAEFDVFSRLPDQWLSSVGMIIIETHGPETSRIVKSRMAENGWSMRRYRNLYYCWPSG